MQPHVSIVPYAGQQANSMRHLLLVITLVVVLLLLLQMTGEASRPAKT